jgi:hypothetical protein
VCGGPRPAQQTPHTKHVGDQPTHYNQNSWRQAIHLLFYFLARRDRKFFGRVILLRESDIKEGAATLASSAPSVLLRE